MTEDNILQPGELYELTTSFMFGLVNKDTNKLLSIFEEPKYITTSNRYISFQQRLLFLIEQVPFDYLNPPFIRTVRSEESMKHENLWKAMNEHGTYWLLIDDNETVLLKRIS
jgi:hypothetical protein